MTGCEQGRRIALLTPYSGGNLGDAAIQDAVVANLRARMRDVTISGISLNCDNFTERHGTEAFPLCGLGRPFYRMSHGSVVDPPEQKRGGNGALDQKGVGSVPIWKARKQMPVPSLCLKTIHSVAVSPWREFRHCFKGYQFLRTQDLLIVSGGGQLDEEWGGPWGHPYALFKWAVLAKIARVPYAIASVGACKLTSSLSRLFLSAALRMARYRSFRDKHSRELAAALLQRAANDPVVPDLAFTLPPPTAARPLSTQRIADSRTVVAISPIAYAKPRNWPHQNHELHKRYIHQIAQVVTDLIRRGSFVVIVWSSLGDDQSVIAELLDHLADDCRMEVARQVLIPTITSWQDFVAAIGKVDFLIASRLHSAILGFITQTPTVAISFDPKVDWLMEDLGMTECLLQIEDFSADDVIQVLDRLMLCRDAVLERIASYRDAVLPIFARQYDALAGLARQQPCR